MVEVRVELETSESLAPGTVIRQTLAPAFERSLSAESSFIVMGNNFHNFLSDEMIP